MNVTLEDAYAEACKALGESIVTQRLLAAEVQRLSSTGQRHGQNDVDDGERHDG